MHQRHAVTMAPAGMGREWSIISVLAGSGTIVACLSAVLYSAVAAQLAVGAFFLFSAAGVMYFARMAGISGSFGWANSVTWARAAAAILLTGAFFDPAAFTDLRWFIVLCAGTALVLDGLDGFLARRLGRTSGFGARFDMETDAALILILSFFVWKTGHAGAWVLAIGLMRYGFVAAGMLWPALTQELPPRFRRKFVCVLQGVILIACLLPVTPPYLIAGAAGFALAALSLSFAADLFWLVRTAVDEYP